jgi:hypothetical protein
MPPAPAEGGIVHTELMHEASAQSASVMHAPPSAHGAQSGPPQSVSVSEPLDIASMHDGAGSGMSSGPTAGQPWQSEKKPSMGDAISNRQVR